MRENYTLTRLFLETDLSQGDEIDLSREQAHYLGSVLRRVEGASIRVFNGRDGEWRAKIAEIGKKSGRLIVSEILRDQNSVPDMTLLFAPVRKHRTAFIIEKATELGVRKLQPVLTQRTQFPRFNVDKARLQAIEAAEQTERLDVPNIEPLQPLKDVLASWDGRPILFADEAGGGKSVEAAVKQIGTPAAILIGPEGGFSPEERQELLEKDFVTPVSLGPRILRADTAALSLLTLWQALSGDWGDLSA